MDCTQALVIVIGLVKVDFGKFRINQSSFIVFFSEICGTGHEYSILCNLQRHYKREHNLSVVEYESLIQNQTELMAYRKKYGYTGYDHTCLFCGMDLLQFRRNNKRIGR